MPVESVRANLPAEYGATWSDVYEAYVQGRMDGRRTIFTLDKQIYDAATEHVVKTKIRKAEAVKHKQEKQV